MKRWYSAVLPMGLCALLAVAVGGCGSTIVPTTPHAPTEASAVQILEAAPSKYEVLGIVETTESLKWGEYASIEPVMTALKKKAAALGATGLLLDAAGAPVKATGMYNGKAFQVPIDGLPATKAMATAVYIVKP
ncbi:hypothetical protein [Humisphaera borealis]|uniref:Lipoprotein n=1 Tax=Humisphaera borealis TaxID=2807512 RepID=A0A7M2WV16_9BACT|nr:hypothetical protein [Humisphaera borealis]QOV89306.1 hypothetical protein IPV69_24375 [Humisphaera borealis]